MRRCFTCCICRKRQPSICNVPFNRCVAVDSNSGVPASTTHSDQHQQEGTSLFRHLWLRLSKHTIRKHEFWTFITKHKIVPYKKSNLVEEEKWHIMNVVLTLFPQKMMYFTSNIWSFTLIQFFNYLDAETSSLVDASQPRRVKFEFLPGHPNRTTHSHQERVRSCWLIYRAARLADTLDLDTHQEENSERPEDVQRAVKRELYTQGTLIMFKPFRAIEDLYD